MSKSILIIFVGLIALSIFSACGSEKDDEHFASNEYLERIDTLTSEECVYAYVAATDEGNIKLLRELIYDKNTPLSPTLETKPYKVNEIEFVKEKTDVTFNNQPLSLLHIYETDLTFIREDGREFTAHFTFNVVKKNPDSPWQLYSWGF